VRANLKLFFRNQIIFETPLQYARQRNRKHPYILLKPSPWVSRPRGQLFVQPLSTMVVHSNYLSFYPLISIQFLWMNEYNINFQNSKSKKKKKKNEK